MAVWRVEANFSLAGVTGPAPSAAPQDGPRAGVYLLARDTDPAAGTGYAIQYQLLWNSFGGGPTYEYQTNFTPRWLANATDGDDPGAAAVWSFVLDGLGFVERILEANGSNGAAYTGGGTLAIEKDTAAGIVTWITPMGNLTKTCASMGVSAGTPLSLSGHGHEFWRCGIADISCSELVKWDSFYLRKDGTIVDGVALDASHPGRWFPYHSAGFTYTGGTASPGVPRIDEAQEAAKYRQSMSYVVGDPANTWSGYRRWRTFTGAMPEDASLDLINIVDHGPFFAAYPDPDQFDHLKEWISYDNGVTAAISDLFSDPGVTIASPSAAWVNAGLVVVWQDGAAIYQATSQALSKSWSIPVTLALGTNPTNPRLVVDPKHGIFYYFFIDGTNLYVQRSFDYGATFLDAAPIEVVAMIPTQTVGAAIGPDGRLLVAYIVASVVTQIKSTDLGKSWS